jgi:hypothetical protein
MMQKKLDSPNINSNTILHKKSTRLRIDKSPTEIAEIEDTPTNQMGVQTSIQPSLYADKTEEKEKEGRNRLNLKISSQNLENGNLDSLQPMTADKIITPTGFKNIN